MRTRATGGTCRGAKLSLLLVLALLVAACGSEDPDEADGGAAAGEEAQDEGSEDQDDQDDGDEPEVEDADDGDIDTERRLELIGASGPQHLDPATAVAACETEMLRWVYDTLIREMADGSFTGGLATEWESPDPETFVLHLREDVQFQDGTAFDAAAVAAHLERGQNDPNSTISGELADIVDIQTPDDYTVELTLAQPRAGILPFIFSDKAGMIPSPTAVEEAGDEYGIFDAVGAGPFAYDRHTPTEDIHVDAWDGYWEQDNRHIPGISMLGAATDFHLERMAAGEINYAAMRDNQILDVQEAAEAGDVDYQLSPTDQYAEIFINWEVEPFDDVRVRQALNHAVDRELLAETLTNGSGTAAWSPMRADSWAHPDELDEIYPHDPERARELLAEAGHPDGLTLEVGMIDNAYYTRMAQAVQDMVSEAGFDFELVPVTPADINNRLYADQDLPIAVTAFRGVADPGLTLEQKFRSSGNSNPAGTTADGVDDLLAEGAASIDQEERAVAYQDAVQIIMEEALSVPMYHNGGLTAFVPELNGVERGYTSCQFGQLVSHPVWFEATE